jgi:hypothetical protein
LIVRTFEQHLGALPRDVPRRLISLQGVHGNEAPLHSEGVSREPDELAVQIFIEGGADGRSHELDRNPEQRPFPEPVAEDDREALFLDRPAALRVGIDEDDRLTGGAELPRERDPDSLGSENRDSIASREPEPEHAASGQAATPAAMTVPAMTRNTRARSSVPPETARALSVPAVSDAIAAATMPRGAMAAMNARSRSSISAFQVASQTAAGRTTSTSVVSTAIPFQPSARMSLRATSAASRTKTAPIMSAVI